MWACFQLEKMTVWVGMLTDRDITIRATAEERDPTKTHVHEVMTQELVYCFEDQEVSEAAKLMQERQIRRDVAVHSGEKSVVAETIKEVS
jgi:CBS domain-containing protein